MARQTDFERSESFNRSAGWTYMAEYVRCGQKHCKKCVAGGGGHGPYWYAYHRQPGSGRLVKKYVGRTLRLVPADQLDAGDQLVGDTEVAHAVP